MAATSMLSPSLERLRKVLADTISTLSRERIACAARLIGDGEAALPEEMALVAAAVERRRNEFAAGRVCAREALSAQGCPPVPLLIGRMREPLWPPSFAGSISHDGRYAAAIAYRSETGAVWLSLDLLDRPDLSTFREIAGLIAHADEASADDSHALARLFSAKEAAIKILSPRLGALLDFRDLHARKTEGGYEIAMPRADAVIQVATVAVDDLILSVGIARDM